MELFAVLNASPDSLNTDSIVSDADTAVARARQVLAEGADALDLGGQGSTDAATVVGWETEWARLEPLVGPLAAFGVPLSIDTWRPQVARRALEAGATVLNAADGMQSDEMWEVAAEFGVPVVVPFLSGPNPREMEHVRTDPIETLIEFFDARLAQADRFGLRDRCIIDPGTGFAPQQLAVGAALRVPEDRVQQPPAVAAVGPAALHRPAVEGHPAALGADGDRAPPAA